MRFARTLGVVHYAFRVVRAIDRRRLAAVALVTLLISLGALFSPTLLDFFSPVEIALAWLQQLGELAVIAAVLMVAYSLLDEGLPGRAPFRLIAICTMLFGLSIALTLLLYAYYAHGFDLLPISPLRLLADSMRWGVPAVFLTLIAEVHRSALQAGSAAVEAEVLRAQLGQGESEQHLALMQAQIEPHFLFNMLGNVRRLYRTRPETGAEAITSLTRYLRTALPQLRNVRGCLGDEIELVRSYLDLFQVKLGTVTPFALTSADQFSARTRPALDSAEYDRDMNEVKSLGARNSTTRTADQTAASIFWSANEVPILNAAARAAAQARNLSLDEHARLFALLYMAEADATVAAFKIKYSHSTWRPITAIRNEASAGNLTVTADPDWEPLLVTPPHPEYPSGHCIVTGAAAEAMREFFGSDQVRFTYTSPPGVGTTRAFTSFSQVEKEVEEV